MGFAEINALDPSTYIFKAFKPLAPAMRPISKAGQWVLRGLGNDLALLAKDGKYVLEQTGRALDWQVATVPLRDNLGNVWNIARSTADALGTARYTLIEGFETETDEVLLRTATRSGDEVVVAGKRINSLLERIKAKLRIAPHEWSTADIDRFVDDFVDNTDALAKFESGVLDVEVWKVMKDLPGFRKNIKVLEQVTALMKSQKAITLFGDAAQLSTSLNKLAKTFDTQTWPSKLSFEDALTQLNKSIDNFQGIIGFDNSVKKAINNSNAYVQDGLWFSLKEMDGLPASSIKGVDLSFEIDELGNSLPCTSANGKCFDVEINGLSPRFIEYKSIQYFKDPTTGKLKFNVGQLKTYLENVGSLSELNYAFNKSKIADPKKYMKTIFEENAEEIFNAGSSKGFFNNIKLKDGSNITINSWQELKGYCTSVDFEKSSLFDFVK